tara:strand:+ start:8091 stop:10070 length:1980 start_codon:yes stop_codon:yes gene_type:complete
MVENKLSAVAKGYSNLNTRAKPSTLDDTQLTNMENMVYSSSGDIEIRLGSEVFKDATQWGAVALIEGKGYELNETGAEIGAILEDGKFFYKILSTYSADPRSIFNPTSLWTEINGVTGSGSLLNVTNKNLVFWETINNRNFFCDGTNQITYIADDHVSYSVPDPAGFQIEFTVDAAAAATLDATYFNGSLLYNVEVTKVTTEGTTLILKQIAGNGRAATTGTLTLIAGTGDATIDYTAVSYSDNFICLSNTNGRLVAISDIGRLWISETNDGTDFNGPQAERLEYGKEDGLSVTNAFPFARSVMVNLTNQELQKSATSSLIGSIKPDVNIIEQQNPADFFTMQRESNRISLYGRSGREINQGFMGLSRDGFIFVDSVDARKEFGLNNRESLSGDIQNVVNRVNFSLSDNIRSTIDDASQRYLCAVPASAGDLNTLVFMYDFNNSTKAVANKAAVHKWSLFTFSLDGAGITSIFTIFGVPFLGLSDGRIICTEVDNTYLDTGNAYRSAFTTKAFDFGVRSQFKTMDVLLLDLVLDSAMKLDIYPLIDEFARRRDYDGTITQSKLITPISLETEDVWTSSASDIWTQNPLDVWGRIAAERYSYLAAKSIPKFQELTLVVVNNDGGKRWGSYGFEMIASPIEEYFDGRIGQNISVDDNKDIP